MPSSLGTLCNKNIHTKIKRVFGIPPCLNLTNQSNVRRPYLFNEGSGITK